MSREGFNELRNSIKGGVQYLVLGPRAGRMAGSHGGDTGAIRVKGNTQGLWMCFWRKVGGLGYGDLELGIGP